MERNFIIQQLNRLTAKDWEIKFSENEDVKLPEVFTQRYPVLPDELKDFLAVVKTAGNKQDDAWFLCVDDYNKTDPGAFPWNELEQMSIDAAYTDNDNEWADEIRTFWNGHLPIMLSVRSEYAYFSIGVDEDNVGKVYHGIEPEFEETTLVADSLSEFLEKFVTECLKEQVEYPYNDFD